MATGRESLASATSILHFAPHPDDVRPECPTCKGRGTVDAGDRSSSIALISLRDKRLKPKRTKLRVGVSVAICFAIISVLVFLLFERTSLVELNRAEAEYEFDDNSTILSSVSFDIDLKIYNKNYISAKYHDIFVQMSHYMPLANCSVNNPVVVPGRSQETVNCHLVIPIANTSHPYLEYVCQTAADHQYSLIFETSVQWQYLSFSAGTITDTDWRCFICGAPHSGSKQNCTH
ncbi:transmembrane protein 106B-like [Sycon ciliatum]|uniref:transmembrane protein 106B-like n=1 Tax=Sycon ciliatum TaxID=27933 RepID=UPI0020AE8207|eukprot:scpid77627/ scgid4722/ Transmembrane protein 106B